MTTACGRIAIAGTCSGVGKTSVALGLARSLRRRGLRVQPFKVGPDFLDPTYLTRAAARTCYNLDTWMMGRPYVGTLFARATADADLALIEGVMGMYDGASPDTSEGSTAEVAALLDAPVLLVADAYGASRSLAAMVKGFAGFEDRPGVAGVIANQTGSERHGRWIGEALRGAGLPPLVGSIPRGAFPELRSRHLGLVTAQPELVPEETLDQLADACEAHLDIEAVLALAKTRCALGNETRNAKRETRDSGVRIGVARDAAFHFYYPDNLEALEQGGAQLVAFSPLADAGLPEGLDALYLGGGYPEEHAEALSANRPMRDAVRDFAAPGRPVYAECGGLMYLGQSLETTAGARFPMAGTLPFGTRMLPRLRSLGYIEVTLTEDCLWGRRGATLRGHEFHYSEMDAPWRSHTGWRCVYSVARRHDPTATQDGFQSGRTLASYIHLHFASRPAQVEHFLACCEERR